AASPHARHAADRSTRRWPPPSPPWPARPRSTPTPAPSATQPWGAEWPGVVGGGRTVSAPPAGTKAVAAATAPATASEGRAPSPRRPAAVAEKRSPAPQGAPVGATGAGTARGAPAPPARRARPGPRVGAT